MTDPFVSMRRNIRAIVAVTALLVFGLGGWAATTELSGAVVAPGSVVVDTNVKKVQHPVGGVVGELLVREGDLVRQGDLLLRLDETIPRSSLAIVVKSMDELLARRARLEAERDSADQIVVPAELLARRADDNVVRIIEGEDKLFQLRREARLGQKAQLRQRIGQLDEEIRGVAVQSVAKSREVEFITVELGGVRDLWRQKLIPIQRVRVLERDAARLEGDRGVLIASMAQAKGKINELELQIIQVDQDLRSEVASELREIQGKLAELGERRLAAEDQLRRIDVRAPQDGIIHQMTASTVGGVVTAAEPMMLIVPTTEVLTIETKVAPQDIDQVRLGQAAVLRMSAFNQRTTPELNGEVTRLSGDLTVDKQTGHSFYTVRVALSPGELGRLNGLKLVPGMPVEAFIQTSSRTVLTYFTKPITDQLARALREE